MLWSKQVTKLILYYRVYWASTETSDKWQGFMEGGVRSGERAVRQIFEEEGKLALYE